MKRSTLVSLVVFAAGLVFAIGLGFSGMTQPSKVIAFLDVFGAWDPSLAFVMGGAIGVHALFAWRANSSRGSLARTPQFADRFVLPEARGVDARLLAGAALFGVGWGIAGYCPGPAVVSLVTLAPETLGFVGAMVAGMMAYALLFERGARKSDESDEERVVV
jgi:uncharacterized membrane protein YedE/YeeE